MFDIIPFDVISIISSSLNLDDTRNFLMTCCYTNNNSQLIWNYYLLRNNPKFHEIMNNKITSYFMKRCGHYLIEDFNYWYHMSNGELLAKQFIRLYPILYNLEEEFSRPPLIKHHSCKKHLLIRLKEWDIKITANGLDERIFMIRRLTTESNPYCRNSCFDNMIVSNIKYYIRNLLMSSIICNIILIENDVIIGKMELSE
jgi:hypothetical protein